VSRRPSALGLARSWSRLALEGTLLLFIASTLFDPADLVVGLKVELFLACWAFAALDVVMRRERVLLPTGLVLSTLTFVAIPTASILVYLVSDGGEPFQGFAILKGYLLITLGLVLYAARIKLLPHLCAMLTLLTLSILGVSALLTVQPGLYAPLQIAGAVTGMMVLTERDYGGGLVMQQVYFVTSPMLTISIAYYLDQAWRTGRTRSRTYYTLLALLSCAGMFVAGSRNNMLVALLLPVAIYVVNSRRKATALVLSSLALLLGVMSYLEQIRTLLNPNELSNSIKLGLLRDYGALFTQPSVLFIGQGLGAYHYWTARGWEDFTSELTYLEMLRNFGVIGASIMLGILIYPLIYAFVIDRTYQHRNVVMGYGFYLLICASNPNMFSSMGMLILPIILANIYLSRRDPRMRGVQSVPEDLASASRSGGAAHP